MFSYWFGSESKEQVPELSDQEQKRLRYKMLIEIHQFDKKQLLPVKKVEPIKPKITKFKRKKKAKKLK